MIVDTRPDPTSGTISNGATVRLFDQVWFSSCHAGAPKERPRSGYILLWFKGSILETEVDTLRYRYGVYLSGLAFPYDCKLSVFRERWETERSMGVPF